MFYSGLNAINSYSETAQISFYFQLIPICTIIILFLSSAINLLSFQNLKTQIINKDTNITTTHCFFILFLSVLVIFLNSIFLIIESKTHSMYYVLCSFYVIVFVLFYWMFYSNINKTIISLNLLTILLAGIQIITYFCDENKWIVFSIFLSILFLMFLFISLELINSKMNINLKN